MCSFKYSFYRKPNCIANYLPFSFSNRPLYVKKSVAWSMFLRHIGFVIGNPSIGSSISIQNYLVKQDILVFSLNQTHKNFMLILATRSVIRFDAKRQISKGLGTDLVSTYSNTLRNSLVKCKTVNGDLDTFCIYVIPCKDYPGFYASETGRTLEEKNNQ